MACSKECYNEYMQQVAVARQNHTPVNLYPERVDMTPDEVVELVEHTPLEVVIETTRQELADYTEDIEEIGLGATIDKINTQRVNSKSKKRT